MRYEELKSDFSYLLSSSSLSLFRKDSKFIQILTINEKREKKNHAYTNVGLKYILESD